LFSDIMTYFEKKRDLKSSGIIFLGCFKKYYEFFDLW